MFVLVTVIHCRSLKALTSPEAVFSLSTLVVDYVGGKLATCYDKLLSHLGCELGQLVHQPP